MPRLSIELTITTIPHNKDYVSTAVRVCACASVEWRVKARLLPMPVTMGGGSMAVKSIRCVTLLNCFLINLRDK